MTKLEAEALAADARTALNTLGITASCILKPDIDLITQQVQSWTVRVQLPNRNSYGLRDPQQLAWLLKQVSR